MAIETAAMEQLLTGLLKAVTQQNKDQAVVFSRLAKASGLDPKIIANSQAKLKQLGDAAEETAKSTTKMQKAGSIVGGALADLTSGIMSTAGNLVNFGYKAMTGSAKMSDFFAAFKDLPIVGSVASLFSMLAKFQEEALVSFQSLSENGISLGKNLSKLRDTAFSAGLTLDEMTKILKNNSETLVQMGGSASQGAKNFMGIGKAMRDSGLARELQSLGFTAEQAIDTIGQFARSVGGLTKQQSADYQGVAKAAAAYGKELDFLARITGESRESLQKKMEEEAMEANFQAFMASQDEDTRKKLMDGLQKSIAGAGKAGADQFKAAALGVAPLSDAAQLASSLLPEMTRTIVQRALDANNRSITSQQFLDKSTRFLATIQAQSAKGYKDNAQLFQTLQLAGDGLGPMFAFAAKNATTLTNAQTGQTMSIEANIQRLEQERAEQERQAKIRKDQADVQIAFNENMRKVGQALMAALNPLTGIMLEIVGKISPMLPRFAKGIQEFITDLFDDTKRAKIVDDLKDKLAQLLADLIKAVFRSIFGSNEETRKKNIELLGGAQVSDEFAHYFANPESIPPAAAPAKPKPQGRSAGSYGTVGSAIENFGNRTDMELHGQQGVFTPEQLTTLVRNGSSNALAEVVSQLNNSQAEMNRLLRDIADNSRRNVEATSSLSGNAFA